MRKRVAELTSTILNPFFVAVVVIVLVSFGSAASMLDAIRWMLISIALSILPIYLVLIYLVRVNRLDSIYVHAPRLRTRIYVLAVVLAGAGYIILVSLGAPVRLIALFVAGFATAVIFACINLWWKISLHTASVAALVTVMIILYGLVAAVSIPLIPLVAWARAELKYHSLAQGIAGALLATVILVAVFYIFGLI